MPRRTTRRAATAIDYLASAAARALPQGFASTLDQLRHDANAVLSDLRGHPAPPFSSETQPIVVPPSLDELDPIAAVLPNALRERYETMRRDIAAVRRALGGRGPSPLVERSHDRQEQRTATPTRTDLLGARTLQVAEVIRETDDAISLVLRDPNGAALTFVAGQFFTVLVDLEGTAHRRAYSLSSDARDSTQARITIKRVRDGRISNHLNDHVREGDTLRVLGPSGSFTVTPVPERSQHFVLVGGGSGITPLMAIARSVLASEPESTITLLYGNRSVRDVIYRDEIDRLAAQHAERFEVRHVLESPAEGWTGTVGRLDRSVMESQIEQLGERAAAGLFYVCGPEPMMAAVREVLVARGIETDRIHEERFVNPAARAESAFSSEPMRAQPIAFRVSKGERDVIAAAGQTLLEAGLAAGLDMPFSCAMGGCAACRVKLIDGEVEMEEPNCLSDGERAQGYVLACVGRAKSRCVVEVPQ